MTLESSELYWKTWPSNNSSFMSLCSLYDCAITLIHMLQGQRSYELFSRTCSLLLRHKDDFPLALLLLIGLEIIAERLELQLPPSATLFHHGSTLHGDELVDVPISFVLPVHPEVCNCELCSQQTGTELGELISAWGGHQLRS